MKKYYTIFIIFCLLYLILFTVDVLICQIDKLCFSISIILVWSMLFLIAIKQMLMTVKTKRKFKHYFFIMVSFLTLFLTIFRMIMR